MRMYEADGGRGIPTISPEKKERISIDDIIGKIKKAASRYPSFKHFVSNIMTRYDSDQDGNLNFQELSAGLDLDKINLSNQEKLALMKHLDVDCDG